MLSPDMANGNMCVVNERRRVRAQHGLAAA
jgi:hypothetical protein